MKKILGYSVYVLVGVAIVVVLCASFMLVSGKDAVEERQWFQMWE
jgi:hypothetical protein